MNIPPSLGFLVVAIPLCLLAWAMDRDYRKSKERERHSHSK